MKKIKLHLLFVSIFCSLFSFNSIAQSDMDLLNEESSATNSKTKEYVSATFKSTRLINTHTVETQGKNVLNIIIQHRFGLLNEGANGFFGLDNVGAIRLGLEYSYDGRLEFGFGRTSTEKILDLYAKYRLLRQTTDFKMPVSVTLLATLNYNTSSFKLQNGFDVFSNELNRMAYVTNIIIGSKPTERLSIQIAPYTVYYNLVSFTDDNNLNYGISSAIRFKITKRMALTGEYALRLNNLNPNTNSNPLNTNKYYNLTGIGLDLETGGHVFQMHLTNAFGLVESQFFTRNFNTWKNFGIGIGFNINRAVALGH